MGQVIDKTAIILKLICLENKVTLKQLTEATGWKKPALCLTLRSLVENGFLTRKVTGEYTLGTLLLEVTRNHWNSQKRTDCLERIAQELSQDSGENINIATIHKTSYKRILQINSTHLVRIASDAPEEHSFYSNATGRILLANASEEVRWAIFKRQGLPKANEWQEVTNWATLCHELQLIRDRGYAKVPHGTEATFFAVAASLPNEMPIAFGIGAPNYRIHSNVIIKLLKNAAEQFIRSCEKPMEKNNE